MIKAAFNTVTILSLTLCSVAAGDKNTTDTKSTKHTTRTEVIYRTNFVQVPIICPRLEVADVIMEKGHTYKLMVADGARAWRNWWTFRPTSNTTARIWVPVADTRPIQWQLVDYTPGFPQVALRKDSPDCLNRPQWVVFGAANVRPVR